MCAVCIQYVCRCKRVGCVCQRPNNGTGCQSVWGDQSVISEPWHVVIAHTLSPSRDRRDTLTESYHTHTASHSISIFPPLLTFSFPIRWATGQAASDRIRSLRPGDDELDAVPMHPQPQSVLLLRRWRRGLLQPGGTSAARTPQLLLQTSLRFDCGGIRLRAGWAHFSYIFPKFKEALLTERYAKEMRVLKFQLKCIFHCYNNTWDRYSNSTVQKIANVVDLYKTFKLFFNFNFYFRFC